MAKKRYYRTAALLNAQPRLAQGARRRTRPVQVPWRLLLAVTGIVAVVLWFWLDARWYVAASRLQIAGTSSPELAREVALGGEILGLHGLWLRSGDIVSNVLATVPSVAEVDAHCRVYPAQCVITVREREPVLVWIAEDGPHWVDAGGVLFGALDERVELPVVTGPLPDGEGIPPEVLAGVRALVVAGVPSDELGYNPQRGLVWSDPLGRRVAFGTGADMALRWHVYRALAADLADRGIYPATLDARFPRAMVYSLEDSW